MVKSISGLRGLPRRHTPMPWGPSSVGSERAQRGGGGLETGEDVRMAALMGDVVGGWGKGAGLLPLLLNLRAALVRPGFPLDLWLPGDPLLPLPWGRGGMSFQRRGERVGARERVPGSLRAATTSSREGTPGSP